MSGSADLPRLPAGFAWGVNGATVWVKARAGRAEAAFTTRLGGSSPPPFDSLNLGALTGDEPRRVLDNRARAVSALGLDPRRVAISRQVHGPELLNHDGPPKPAIFAGEGGEPDEADGHLLRAGGLAGLVLAADCLPIVIAGPRGVGVVHGGWRGLAAGILARACGRLDAETMVIGPGIGPCCYEVGPEVAAEFSGLGDGVLRGRMLDLAAAAAALGRRAGVGEVASCGLCTSCNDELFFSHRRDGPRTGRQAGIGWIRGDG